MQKSDETPWYHPRHVMNYSITMNKQSSQPDVTPKEIYDYLDARIYGQTEAKRATALFCYRTIRNQKINMLTIGPSGCGKTELYRVLSEWDLFADRISIIDASSLTLEGWKGEHKVSTLFDDPVCKTDKQCILVLDEIDKALYPKTSSDGSDYAKSLQGELLKPLEGTWITCGKNENQFCVDTRKINFSLLGAFSLKAEEIAEKSKPPCIGFGAAQSDITPYSQPILMKDLLSYGVMPEFLGRIQTIVNMEPMAEADYVRMLTEHHSGIIRRLEQCYGISLHLSSSTCRKIASESFEEQLGVRGMENKIKNMIDNMMFENCTQTEFEF